jgi:predicted nucleic acid-binding protein
MTYFDSGLLVKAHCPEPDMAIAHELIEGCEPPVPFTELHGLEVRTALRLKRFRGELTAAELAGALETLQEDLAAGLLARPAMDLEAVFLQAEVLSARHAAETGARSLDILHVAAAVELEANAFASLDERQRKVAAKAGLKLLPRTLPVRGAQKGPRPTH